MGQTLCNTAQLGKGSSQTESQCAAGPALARSPEMPNHSQMQDRYGLPLSTSSTLAAERFIEGIDLLLEQNFDPEERFTQAIEAALGFALSNSALDYM